MTMYSAIEANAGACETVGCVRDLLIAALQIIDSLDLPGDIGAHLDLAIHKLGASMPGSDATALESLAP